MFYDLPTKSAAGSGPETTPAESSDNERIGQWDECSTLDCARRYLAETTHNVEEHGWTGLSYLFSKFRSTASDDSTLQHVCRPHNSRECADVLRHGDAHTTRLLFMGAFDLKTALETLYRLRQDPSRKHGTKVQVHTVDRNVAVITRQVVLVRMIKDRSWLPRSSVVASAGGAGEEDPANSAEANTGSATDNRLTDEQLDIILRFWYDFALEDHVQATIMRVLHLVHDELLDPTSISFSLVPRAGDRLRILECLTCFFILDSVAGLDTANRQRVEHIQDTVGEYGKKTHHVSHLYWLSAHCNASM
jgi:hypothetical protein